MRTLFFPLYRMAVSYVVSSGRRWSVLEHLLLFEVASSKRTTAELADLTGMPDRLVVEALINLLRASWLEVRSTEAGVFFAATAAGRRWAAEPELPATLQREVKWLSVCLDRLTGSWLRADELDLVHEKEVPADADTVAALKHTFDPNDGALRDLFTLDADESLEPTPPQFRNASRYMARVGVAFGQIETGLPPSALPRLRQALIEAARELQWDVEVPTVEERPSIEGTTRDDIGDDDIIVGGRAHLEMLRGALECTRSAFILHTCFPEPGDDAPPASGFGEGRPTKGPHRSALGSARRPRRAGAPQAQAGFRQGARPAAGVREATRTTFAGLLGIACEGRPLRRQGHRSLDQHRGKLQLPVVRVRLDRGLRPDPQSGSGRAAGRASDRRPASRIGRVEPRR